MERQGKKWLAVALVICMLFASNSFSAIAEMSGDQAGADELLTGQEEILTGQEEVEPEDSERELDSGEILATEEQEEKPEDSAEDADALFRAQEETEPEASENELEQYNLTDGEWDGELDVVLEFEHSLDNTGSKASVFPAMDSGQPAYVEDAERGTVIGLDHENFVTLGSQDPVDYSESFTYAFWYKNVEYSSDPVIFGNTRWDSGGYPGIGLVIKTGGNLYLNATTNNGSNTSQGTRLNGGGDLTAGSIEARSWIHVAGVFDAEAKTITLYQNGLKQNSFSAGSFEDGFSNGHPTLIGQGYRGDDYSGRYNSKHKMQIDDFILTGQALTDAEIKTLSGRDQIVVPAEPGEPDILNVDFRNGNAEDVNGRDGKTVGNPQFEQSRSLGGQIVSLDAASAFRYPMTAQDYDDLYEGFTIESTFRFNSIGSGEQDILSSQQSGGFGLGINGDNLYFWMNGGDLNTKFPVQAGKWYHVAETFQPVENGYLLTVYVYDETGHIATFEKINAKAKLAPNSPASYFLFVGGDTDADGNLQFSSDCSVASARVYNQAIGEDQVAKNASEIFSRYSAGGAAFDFHIEGPSVVAANAGFTLNFHINAEEPVSVKRLAYDLVFDPELFEFDQDTASAATVSKDRPGVVHIELANYTGLPKGRIADYASTRHARITMKAKEVEALTTTEFTIANMDLGFDDGVDMEFQVHNREISIFPRSALDFNGDGIVSVGDVAAAPADIRPAVVDALEGIFPYKRAIILTLDGAGAPFNPDWIYYAPSAGSDSIVAKAGEHEAFGVRRNPFLMTLLENDWAVSHTAEAVGELHSAENYGSILHGVKWHDFPPEYRIDNTSTGRYYWPDHEKEEAEYPSVFSVLAAARPDRAYACFSEWSNIQNGIVEPRTPVWSLQYSAGGKRSFASLTDYIKQGDFKNTTLVFLQDDKLDSIGHANGFNTAAFWNEFSKYDDHYKNLLDALKFQDMYDDTFIISNADHGGNKYNHDQNNWNNTLGKVIDREIFTAVGGQTVNPGAVLQGGTNGDVSGIVLSALRVDSPDVMSESKVFDDNMFLSQEEMAVRGRSVEAVTFTDSESLAVIQLDASSAPLRQVSAADMVIELGGVSVTNVLTEGTVLRQTEQDGKLLLTVAYESQPETLATITFNNGKELHGEKKITEIMLAAANGKEIYPDLSNLVDETPGKTMLAVFVEMAENLIWSGNYKNDGNMTRLKVLLQQAVELQKDESTTQSQLAQLAAEIQEVMEALVPDTNTGNNGGGRGGGGNKIVAAKPAEDSDQETEEAGYPKLNLKEHMAYISGDENGLFHPENNLTRAEAAIILYQIILDDDKESFASSSFSDVKPGAWYHQAVAYLERAGVIGGYEDGTYRPDTPVSRAEFAAMASRFADLSQGANPFSDIGGHWAEQYIVNCHTNNWISGYPDGTFKPDKQITRVEAVVVINRLLGRKASKENISVNSARKYSDLPENHWGYAEVMAASDSGGTD